MLLNYNIIVIFAEIAQLVEQRIENPRVSSSNLDLGTLKLSTAKELGLVIVVQRGRTLTLLLYDLGYQNFNEPKK